MTKPITPALVETTKKDVIPDEVFEAFNELIVKNYNNGYASFSKKEVVRLICQKKNIKPDVFEGHWLDVEIPYRQAGWKVEYDKPGFNESYEATFAFKKKK